MTYTKEEFKKMWESDENGGGITFDDIIECALEWGLVDEDDNHKEMIDKVLEEAQVFL